MGLEILKDIAHSLPIPAKIINLGITGAYKKGVFAAIPEISKIENSPVNFETHSNGVGYCGDCFGTENNKPKIENVAPFPAGIDTRPVLTYRSFTTRYKRLSPRHQRWFTSARSAWACGRELFSFAPKGVVDRGK